jgi:hypothetical protein
MTSLPSNIFVPPGLDALGAQVRMLCCCARTRQHAGRHGAGFRLNACLLRFALPLHGLDALLHGLPFGVAQFMVRLCAPSFGYASAPAAERTRRYTVAVQCIPARIIIALAVGAESVKLAIGVDLWRHGKTGGCDGVSELIN